MSRCRKISRWPSTPPSRCTARRRLSLKNLRFGSRVTGSWYVSFSSASMRARCCLNWSWTRWCDWTRAVPSGCSSRGRPSASFGSTPACPIWARLWASRFSGPRCSLSCRRDI
ncbi:Uncharacterised protein [Bordetella pertussis]|nr:Uncharacterised protein [Bordetella pertussis]